MLEALNNARKDVQGMNEVTQTDYSFSDRELEVWEHTPYLFKLYTAFCEQTEGMTRIDIALLRSILGVLSSVASGASTFFGESQMERDLKAIHSMMDESKQDK